MCLRRAQMPRSGSAWWTSPHRFPISPFPILSITCGPKQRPNLAHEDSRLSLKWVRVCENMAGLLRHCFRCLLSPDARIDLRGTPCRSLPLDRSMPAETHRREVNKIHIAPLDEGTDC